MTDQGLWDVLFVVLGLSCALAFIAGVRAAQ